MRDPACSLRRAQICPAPAHLRSARSPLASAPISGGLLHVSRYDTGLTSDVRGDNSDATVSNSFPGSTADEHAPEER